MTKQLKFAACLLAVAISGFAEAGQRLAIQPFPFNKLMLDEFLTLVQASGAALYRGPEVECKLGQDDCTVTITPLEVFDGDAMLTCASQVGTLKIVLGKDPKPGTVTKIHWKIGAVAHPHTPPSGATYGFKGNGLMVLRDDSKATAGKADSVSTTEIVMSYKYKPVPSSVVSDVVYYPLVFQDIPGKDPALCGSGDPKIVNH